MKKLLLSALLGGFVAFLWYTLSWTVFHLHPTQKFTDEAAVAAVLNGNAAPEAGVYVLPGDCGPDEAARTAHMKAMQDGPFLFGVVRSGPQSFSMPASIVKSLLGQMVCAYLFASLLLCTRPMSYGARVFFVLQAALLAGLLCHLPPMIWWGMPTTWVLREFLDLAVAWTLAGLVIAKFANPSPETKP
jgi:hypothetical protein